MKDDNDPLNGFEKVGQIITDKNAREMDVELFREVPEFSSMTEDPDYPLFILKQGPKNSRDLIWLNAPDVSKLGNLLLKNGKSE